MQRRPLDVAFVCLAAVYLCAFAALQTPGLFDRHVLEWDARAMVLPALRWHGSTLFHGDLLVDLAARYDPPLWKLVYWLGTLVTDPFEVSKILPFALYGVLVWQAFCLGRRRGGVVLGATCAVAVVHCVFVWNRMAGGHARGFGFPLVLALLRYADGRHEKRSLATLLLMTVGYPSVFVFSAPAYILFRRDRLVRTLAVCAVGAVIASSTMWSERDARLGSPPTYAQAATLRQMKAGSAQPYYPLPSLLSTLRTTVVMPFAPDGDHWHGVAWGGLALLSVVALLLLLSLPGELSIFVLLPLCGLTAAIAAQLAAYQLYLPDRMIQFSWIPVALLALPLLLQRAVERPLLAGLVTCALLFGLGGDGLPLADNLTDFHKHDTPAIRFVATLSEDALIATHAERASYVMTFAGRRVLFAASLNVPFFYDYAVEIDRRMEAFYRAYYAPDLAGVLALRRDFGVGYVIVDARDFGPDAAERGNYFAPWGEIVRSLLEGHDPATLALAHPPEDSIVYRGGDQLVIDLQRLHP